MQITWSIIRILLITMKYKSKRVSIFPGARQWDHTKEIQSNLKFKWGMGPYK